MRNSVNRLVTSSTGFAILKLAGKVARALTKLDAIAAITANRPETAIFTRRAFNCFSVGGMKDCCFFAAALVARSNIIATKTTANPATKPRPVLRIVKASITGLPSPGAAIKAAITTNESAAITV